MHGIASTTGAAVVATDVQQSNTAMLPPHLFNSHTQSPYTPSLFIHTSSLSPSILVMIERLGGVA